MKETKKRRIYRRYKAKSEPTLAELVLRDSAKVSDSYQADWLFLRKVGRFNDVLPRPAMDRQEILLFIVDPETLKLTLKTGIALNGKFVWM